MSGGAFSGTSLTVLRSLAASQASEGRRFNTAARIEAFGEGNAPNVSPTAFDSNDSVIFYYLAGTTGWSSPFDGFTALLWNPQAQTSDGRFGVQANQFGFNITGTTNIPIVVEASTNLSCGWVPLQSIKPSRTVHSISTIRSGRIIPDGSTAFAHRNCLKAEGFLSKFTTGTGFFIADDGYLISNYHVVKDAAKVRLLTSAGLIDAKAVKVDAANDLALLKATGKFLSLPIIASRTVQVWAARWPRSGFPTSGCRGSRPIPQRRDKRENRVAVRRGG